MQNNIYNELAKLHPAMNFKSKKILVVGDVMLDSYWFGDVERISPEAPVPVANIRHQEYRLGGAANVAKNIASLGGDVALLSLVGVDNDAIELQRLLALDGVGDYLIRDDSVKTIVKLRVLSKQQQLIRLDFERAIGEVSKIKILTDFKQLISQFSVVIFSDYAKGSLHYVSEMIEIARAHNVFVLVDPKGHDYSKYKTANIITPNKKELREASAGVWNNEDDIYNSAHKLIQDLTLDYLLLTRSEEGMSLFSSDSQLNYPTHAQEVFDVSGAGDTVIATLGLMIANDFSIQASVILANLAASVVVAKVGTAALNQNELQSVLNVYLQQNF